MLKRFDDNSTNPIRSVQAWLVLIGQARDRRTLTLAALAGLMHLPDPSQAVYILGHIMFLCREQQLPPLVALVVSEKTGAPVLGMAVTDLGLDREARLQLRLVRRVAAVVRRLPHGLRARLNRPASKRLQGV